MPILEIITIGTELLLGEIQDTNSTYIARTLRDHGIDIYRLTTIGDNAARIASAIREALNRADIIITTGGLGPTIDDPTRQAVADATDRKLIFVQSLWDQIEDRFLAHGRTPTDNNRRQAYIPENSIPIHNPEGTAPCFIVEVGDSCVVSLPGVPSEMKLILHESIIPFLNKKFNLKSQLIKATVLHAASMGESAIDQVISDLEQLNNPSVGLLAHPGQVDIRVTVKSSSEEEAQMLSQPIIDDLYQRLGDVIYGKDDETLESVISAHLKEKQYQLALVEYGLDDTLIGRMRSVPAVNLVGKVITANPGTKETLSNQLKAYCKETNSQIGFGAALTANDTVSAHFVFLSPTAQESLTRTYGGPKDHAFLWAQNIGLDFLRRQLLSSPQANQQENHEKNR